jgi:hypothetical protein
MGKVSFLLSLLIAVAFVGSTFYGIVKTVKGRRNES